MMLRGNVTGGDVTEVWCHRRHDITGGLAVQGGYDVTRGEKIGPIVLSSLINVLIN